MTLITRTLLLCFLIAHAYFVKASDVNYQLIVKGYQGVESNNPPVLFVYDTDYLPYVDALIPPKEYQATRIENDFLFEITLTETTQVCKLVTSDKSRIIIRQMVAQIGDSISIEFSQDTVKFSGVGFEKYRYSQDLESRIENQEIALLKLHQDPKKLRTLGDKGYVQMMQNHFWVADSLNKIIDKDIPPANIDYEAGYLIKKEISSRINQRVTSNAGFYFHNGKILQSDSNLSILRDLLLKMNDSPTNISDELDSFSPEFLMYTIGKLTLLSNIDKNKETFFKLADSLYNGAMYEKTVSAKILSSYSSQENIENLLLLILPKLKNEKYREALKSLRTSVVAGVPIYDFSLPNTEGKQVSIKDFRGKIVYLHFWFTGCVPCRALYKNSLEPVENFYKENPNIVFVSVSMDKDKERWLQSIEQNVCTGKDAINLYTENQGGYHEVCKKLYVTGAPASFLIDENGRVITTNNELLGRSGPEKLKEIIDLNLKRLGI